MTLILGFQVAYRVNWAVDTFHAWEFPSAPLVALQTTLGTGYTDQGLT